MPLSFFLSRALLPPGRRSHAHDTSPETPPAEATATAPMRRHPKLSGPTDPPALGGQRLHKRRGGLPPTAAHGPAQSQGEPAGPRTGTPHRDATLQAAIARAPRKEAAGPNGPAAVARHEPPTKACRRRPPAPTRQCAPPARPPPAIRSERLARYALSAHSRRDDTTRKGGTTRADLGHMRTS